MTWQPTEEDWKVFAVYKQWWAEALRQILGWSDKKITQWIKHRHDLYTTKIALWCCLHRAPVEELMSELVPPALRNNLATKEGVEWPQLEYHLQVAVENHRGLECYYPPYPDWEACRQRINKVLAEYGNSLPGPENPPGKRDE